MRKFIEKLRSKPVEERRHIINISTFISAAILIVLWTFTLNKSFNNPDLKVQVEQDIEPLKGFTANVVDGYNVITEEKN